MAAAADDDRPINDGFGCELKRLGGLVSSTRGPKQDGKPLFPAGLRCPELSEHGQPLAKHDLERIERSGLAGKSVAERFLGRLLRESAEEPVKDNQCAPKILVEARFVAGMVEPVMGRAVQDPFKEPKAWQPLGMDEELVAEVEAENDQNGDRVEPNQSQRDIKEIVTR